jgi:type VI secretion system protein VasG
MIASRCTDVDSGARNVYNILTGTMLPDMSAEVLSRMADGEAIAKIHVGVKDEKFTYDIS